MPNTKTTSVPLQEELEQQGTFLFKHRGALPFVIILTGLVVYVKANQPGNVELLQESPPVIYERLCLVVSLFGLLVRILTVGFSHRNTSGRNTQYQVADSINTKGMYSIVRHPLYAGNFLVWIGMAMLTADIWFIAATAAVFVVYHERIMFAEEQFLRRKFGEAYLNWAANTPAFLPRFSKFEKPNIPFSIKTVLRREKNGIWALFAVIFAYQQITRWYWHHDFEVSDKWVAAGVALTTFNYVAIKALQKTTHFFEDTKTGRTEL